VRWPDAGPTARALGVWILLAAVLFWVCGCTSASRQEQPRLVLEVEWEVMALDPVGRSAPDHVLLTVWERTPRPAESSVHVLDVDLATGHSRETAVSAKAWAARGPLDYGPGAIAVAPNGRLAVAEHRVRGSSRESRIWVVEVGGAARPVTPWDGRSRLGLQWGPDSASLCYFAFTVGEKGIVGGTTLTVATLAAGAQAATEREVRKGCSLLDFVRWSSRGECLYHARHVSETASQLVSVAWPSGEEQVLHAGGWISHMSVAETSDDLVWVDVSPRTGRKPTSVVWLRRAGRSPEPTGIRFESIPRELVVSPDGAALAVVPEERGLEGYDLRSGERQIVSAFAKDTPWGIRWVMDGKAIAFVTEGRKLWVVPRACLQAAGDAPL